MFHLVKVSHDNKVSLVSCKNRNIILLDLQKEVGGFIEVVRLPRLPELAMIVNENGYYLKLPFNAVGSGLYGDPNHAILGDIIFASFFNSNKDCECDVYAFDTVTALRLKYMMQNLLKEYEKAGLI